MERVRPDDDLVDAELDAELAEAPWRGAKQEPESGWSPPHAGGGSNVQVIRG
jgi:hypothetical protein